MPASRKRTTEIMEAYSGQGLGRHCSAYEVEVQGIKRARIYLQEAQLLRRIAQEP